MESATLRARQAPLKERYKAEPESALVTSHAEGRLDAADIACHVTGWRGTVEAGLHPATGGDGSQACSADILLRALVACTGVTLNSVATAMGVQLDDVTIRAEGDWDARGTLGISKEVPVGIQDIRLRVTIDSPADAATLDKLLTLTERFCVIYQTLAHPPRLSLERRETAAA